MSVGYLMNMGNLFDGLTDEQMLREEIKIAVLADELGFDDLWAIEHHFNSYAMCPSNFQLLAYLAPLTKRIKLGLGAVILPWHDPLRVIENIIQLDLLTEGRLLVAFGRGLAKHEYDGFRLDMSEARGRFNESARFVADALESGIAEYDGEFYKQPRVEIRPAPSRSFKDRLYAVASSGDSLQPVAELGASMMSFVSSPIEAHAASIDIYRDHFLARHGVAAPPPVLNEFVYCHEDAAEAERGAREYISKFFVSFLDHYGLLGTGFDGIKGYDSYSATSAMLRAVGKEAALEGFIAAQTWGTPAQIVEKFEAKHKATKGHRFSACMSFGAMPYAEVARSMTLFAKESLPAINDIQKTAALTTA